MTAADENRLADYRAGRLAPEDRRAFEEEVLASDELAGELYAEVSLDAALSTGRNAASAGPSSPRWWRRRDVAVLVPLAAAALLLLVLRAPDRDRAGLPAPPAFRGEASGARCLSPIGDVETAPSRFRWSHDPAAVMYRFELYDASSALLFRTTTSDTTIEIPAGTIGEEVPFDGYWKVVPMNAAGVERSKPPPALLRVMRP